MYRQECKKCLLVGDQVFFEWRAIPNNKVMITCYVGTYGTPGIVWRVGGTRIKGIELKGVIGSIYVKCKKCVGNIIVIDKDYHSHISVPYCSNWMVKEYAKEYPIDYSKVPQNTLIELKEYRIYKE
nr:CPPV345 Ig-like domain protein [Cooks petrelpox virus]